MFMIDIVIGSVTKKNLSNSGVHSRFGQGDADGGKTHKESRQRETMRKQNLQDLANLCIMKRESKVTTSKIWTQFSEKKQKAMQV